MLNFKNLYMALRYEFSDKAVLAKKKYHRDKFF